MVQQSRGCLIALSIVFFMFGISYLLTRDRTQYLNNAIGTFYLSRTGINIFNNNNGSEVKHSTRYAKSSKRFVLHAIDNLNISIKTKTSMKELFKEGRSDAKLMLELLVGTFGDKFQKLNNGYKQRFPDAMIIECKKCGTTFFNAVLRRHSSVASQAKEVHFFDRQHSIVQWNHDMDVYRSYMMYSFADQITMEKTPSTG